MSINTYYPTAELKERTAATYYKALYDFFSTNEAVLKWCDVTFDAEDELLPITFAVKGSPIEIQLIAYSSTTTWYIKRQIRTNSSTNYTSMADYCNAASAWIDLPVKICENDNSLYISIGGANYNIVIFNAVLVDDENVIQPAAAMINALSGTYKGSYFCVADNLVKYMSSTSNIGSCEKRIITPFAALGFKMPNVYRVDGGTNALAAGIYKFDGADYAADGNNFLYKL